MDIPNQGGYEHFPEPYDIGPPPPLALEAEDQEPKVDLGFSEQIILCRVSSIQVFDDHERVDKSENHQEYVTFLGFSRKLIKVGTGPIRVLNEPSPKK